MAVVQVGSFENPHSGIRNYRKSAEIRPILPLELLGIDPDACSLQDAVDERGHRLEI